MKSRLARTILDHVLAQVRADAHALKSLPYARWRSRVEHSVKSFVPSLVAFAPDLMREVELTLNSPHMVRESWNRIVSALDGTEAFEDVKKDAAVLTAELIRESDLLSEITGETVSSIISDFCCRVRPDMRKNNRSTYPDLFFGTADYSRLPQRTRSHPTGPALKKEKPTSVPDGVEIKSQRGRSIRVDCHHPHQGMHLVVTFGQDRGIWEAYDVFIAYLSSRDYTQATRNTTATTEKFSFSNGPFISVLGGSARGAIVVPAMCADDSEPTS